MLTQSLIRPLTRPLTSAVTEGGGGGLGPFYGVMANPPAITITDTTSTTIAGGVGTGPTDPAFKYTGPPRMTWAANTAYQVVGDGTTTDISCFVVIEFESNAPQVELKLVRFNTKADIRVDGQLIQSAGLSFDSAGSTRLVKMDWSGDANPTKLRRYRLAGYNLPFAGAWKTSGYTITYPTVIDSQPLMAFIGDSYTLGTGANGPDQNYANTLATALGYGYWSDGIGSTGWLSASPNDAVSRINKRTKVLTRTPAVIITALGLNDAGGNMTTLATAYDAAIADLQASWPSARIISLGPWTPLGSTANLDAVASTISARAAADNAGFVDIADIINAGNKATYTGGDNVHPVQIGHDYLGRTIAARMKPKLL